jgi:putative flippase GtrA
MRDAAVSFLTFAFGLGIMWVLVESANMNQAVAAAGSFVAGNSLHYALARSWVFRGTTRGFTQGYGYFLASSAIGLVIMVLVFTALSRWTPVHYLLARALASLVAGSIIFVLNAVFNFKRV